MANGTAQPEPVMDFASVVGQYQSMVFSIAYHLLRDRSAAEELAQDVFLQLYRVLPTLRSASHVAFWLRKTASHRCIDHIRRCQRRAEVDIESLPEGAEPPSPSDPLLNRRLRKLVATLPEVQRAIIVLRYQEDLDPNDIARVLEMPVNTVKSYLQRALGTLREKARDLGVK